MDDFQKLSDNRCVAAFYALNDKCGTVVAVVAFTDAMHLFVRAERVRVPCVSVWLRHKMVCARKSIHFHPNTHAPAAAAPVAAYNDRLYIKRYCNCSYTSSMSKRRPTNVLEYKRAVACLAVSLCVRASVFLMFQWKKVRCNQPTHAHSRKRKNITDFRCIKT